MRLGIDALPVGLVGDAARAHLLEARVDLGACFSFGAFELRLDNNERVDALACVSADDDGLAAVPPVLAAGLPVGVVAAVEHWRSRETERAAIEALWIELDCIAGVDSAPFAFLRFSQRSVTDDVMSAAIALGASTTTQRRLRAVLAHVAPFGAQVLHVAAVSSRHDGGHAVGGVRLHLGLRPDDIAAATAAFVAPLASPNVRARLEALVARWPRGQPLGVQFDVVDDTPSAFIDLELYLPTSPVHDPTWTPALAAIREHVLVDAPNAAKLDRVLDWPSHDGEPSPLWPDDLVANTSDQSPA